MLVVTRREGRKIYIGHNNEIRVKEIDLHNARVTLLLRQAALTEHVHLALGGAVEFGEATIMLLAISAQKEARIGIDAPATIQVSRDDISRRRHAERQAERDAVR